MSNEFMREERYIVFKMSDLGNSLKGDEIRRLAREYAEQRRLKGKKPLECVVVEKDWPEYEPTWRAIEARVTGAQPAPIVPEGFALVNATHFLAVLDREDWLTAKNRAELRAMLAAAPKPEAVDAAIEIVKKHEAILDAIELLWYEHGLDLLGASFSSFMIDVHAALEKSK